MRKGKTVTPPLPAPPSSRYRFFCWAVAFLAVAQLLVGLDYINIWPSAEAELIWSGVQTAPATTWVSAFMGTIPTESPYWLLAYRVPSLIFYLLGIALFFLWGKALFGNRSVELTLLVGAASLLLPVLAKTASLDIWRFGLELGFWLSLLHFTKTPTRKWLVRSSILGALAILVGSWASLVLFVIWQVAYFRILVAENEGLKKQIGKPFVIIYLVFGLSLLLNWALGYHGSLGDYFYFNFLNLGHLKFFFYALLGIAPFIGFTLAALRDLFYKVKRGEELSQLLLIGLLGSFLTLSLVFPFLLIFLTAKQLENYFKVPNYPWQDWVKAGQVLHIILVFFLVALTLLGGFIQFQNDGFRAVLGCSAAYWMFSFVGVIGLYGNRRDYVLGGMTLAGLIALLFFWIQVYPFIHLQRNWPQRLQTQIEKTLPGTKEIGLNESDPPTLPLAPYFQRAGYQLRNTTEVAPNSESLTIRKLEPNDSISEPRIEISGWPWLWSEERWGGF